MLPCCTQTCDTGLFKELYQRDPTFILQFYLAKTDRVDLSAQLNYEK